MSLEEDILIERFLKNELSETAKKEILQRMENDAEFREKVLLEQQLFETLNEDSWSFAKNIDNTELKEYTNLFRSKETLEIKEAITEAHKNYTKKTSSGFKKWTLYASVAAVALLVSVYFFNPLNDVNLSSEQLYASNLSATELASVISRGDDNAKLSEGETFFKNKEYQKSIDIFSEELKKDTLNSNLYLYLAISQTESNQFSNAEETLDRLIKSDLVNAEKGYWFKSLLYLKSNELNKSKTTLQTIIDSSYYKKEEAKNLLKKLSSIQ